MYKNFKTGIFFLAAIFSVLNNLNGQPASIHNSHHVKITLADTSNNNMLHNNPNISRVVIKYEHAEPMSVYIYIYKDAQKESILETYDLGFDGDSYLLSNKYKGLILPSTPVIEISNLKNRINCQNTWLEIKANIFKDSISYELKQDCFKGASSINYRSSFIGTPPAFQGDLDSLIRKIEQSYKNSKQGSNISSILVFSGIVDPGGTLSDLRLIAGAQSSFSNFMIKELRGSENKWKPANIGGRLIKASTKFYVRLHPEGKIELLTPRRLLNASGK